MGIREIVYIQVMNDWARMCASMQGGIAKCDNCPLFKVLCQYKPNEKVDLVSAEKIIEKWAEDNPEPVYPSWEEWLQSVGVMESSEELLMRIKGQLLIDGIPAHAVPTSKVLQPMDAEIAQKLGIEPVPVVHGDCGATNETDARKKLEIEPE